MKAKLLTISLMVGLFMGCHDFLDVKPVGKLIPTEVEEFENILNNTYTVDWYYMDNNKGTLLASLGDNLQISENSANYNYTATHPNINRYAAYTFKLPYGNPEKPDYFWEWGTYRAVGLLNNVIDGVNDVKNEKTAKLAEELSAQARAARAWSYLTMAMIYGPVYDPAGANDTKTIPYRTAASPTEANPALSTTAEVFGLAKADIDFALKSVPDNVNHPARMNRCAVQTLMAYYYMFARDFGKMLEYADMAPLAYLHLALDGNRTQTHIRHLLIDEMQDYSPIQYKVIQKLYPCRKTILGDASQSVNPYGSSTAAMIQKTFTTGEVMKLCKSYRSTFEITSLAQKIQANNELEPIMRHGEQPEILPFKNTEEETTGLVNLISDFRNSGYTSLGIICKTETQAKALAQKLQVHTDNISLLSSLSSAYTKGIVVTSAHMAKGLEFDEVIVPQADNQNYHSTIDKSMLYVAVTRAMHKITLTYSGIPNRFIE